MPKYSSMSSLFPLIPTNDRLQQCNSLKQLSSQNVNRLSIPNLVKSESNLMKSSSNNNSSSFNEYINAELPSMINSSQSE